MLEASTTLALLGQTAQDDATPLPVLLFYLGIPIFTLVAVGVACWVFWRAKRRDDERERLEAEGRGKTRNGEELTWRNARSS